MKIKFKIFLSFWLILVFSPQVLAVEEDPNDYNYLKFLGETIEKIKSDYVDDVKNKELVESAIDGMLSSLDPHSSFLNAESLKQMKIQTKGAFGGLGIEVTMENGFVKVISPIDDTPAYKAGIKAGDYITHLDGKSVIGLNLNEAVDKMRGPVGTKLKVTIGRSNQEAFDVTIKRDIIKISSVKSKLEEDVGYIRITTFSEQTSKSTRDAIKKFKKCINCSAW